MTGDSRLVLRWFILTTATFLVQVAFVDDLRVFGVHPELMLLVAVCAGLVGGPGRGGSVGFFAGLLVDFTLTGSLGVSALCYTLIGYGVGVAEESVLRATRLLSVAIATTASVVGVLLYAAVSELLGARTLSDPNLMRIVGIVAIINGLACTPLLSLARRAEGTRSRAGAY